jgi:hypothetical protein
VYGMMFMPTSSTATPIAANTATVVLVMDKVEKLNYICTPSQDSIKLEENHGVQDYENEK